ncbi:MAG: serine acetyltransferase [bacterium]
MSYSDLTDYIKSDFERYYLENESTKNYLHLFAVNPGLWVLVVYRICRYFKYDFKIPLIKQFISLILLILSHILRFMTCIELPAGAKIGKSCFIPHIGSLIISYKAEIGDNCSILPGVVIGRSGRGKNDGVPKLGSQVFIGAGAKIIGDIKIEDNVAIGANAVVSSNLTKNAVAVGIPAKVVSYKGSSDFIRYNKNNGESEQWNTL